MVGLSHLEVNLMRAHTGEWHCLALVLSHSNVSQVGTACNPRQVNHHHPSGLHVYAVTQTSPISLSHHHPCLESDGKHPNKETTMWRNFPFCFQTMKWCKWEEGEMGMDISHLDFISGAHFQFHSNGILSCIVIKNFKMIWPAWEHSFSIYWNTKNC